MSIREQIEGVAQSVSIWLILFGGVGGAVIALGNIISISNAVSEGSAGLNLVGSLIALIFGLGLAGYFSYLALIRARLKRERR